MKRRFRLVRSSDFKRVRREGKSFAHPFFVLLFTLSDAENSKAGISISRAVGNAVFRNQKKRQIREILNDLIINVNDNYDIMIIVRHGIKNASFNEIKSALTDMFQRSGIV